MIKIAIGVAIVFVLAIVVGGVILAAIGYGEEDE